MSSSSTEAESCAAAGAWTPAPWNCRNANRGLHAHRIDGGGLIIADVFFRHTIQHAPDEATAHANARLIESAPDLFAALVGIVNVARRDTAEFAAAKAAIRKAIGQNDQADARHSLSPSPSIP